MTTTKTAPFKAGQKVSHQLHGTGKVLSLHQRTNGLWIAVDFGDKKTARNKTVRPTTLTKA